MKRSTSRPEPTNVTDLQPPEFGRTIEIRPGLHWTRFPVPMKIGHVNVYLIRDGDGWAVIDTGLGDEPTISTWQSLLGGALAGYRITRIIVTHCHFDHVGAAGWLCEKTSATLIMSRTEYLSCRTLLADPGFFSRPSYQNFLRQQGVDANLAAELGTVLGRFADNLTGLPDTYRSVADGDLIVIGDRSFEVRLTSGHADAQIVLFCRDENFALVTDQIVSGVNPLLILPPAEPDCDNLERHLRSMNTLAETLPNDLLALPGHGMPVRDVERAIALDRTYHEDRCSRLHAECFAAPRSPIELARLLFSPRLSLRQTGHALRDVIPYANHLVSRGQAAWIEPGSDGIRRLVGR